MLVFVTILYDSIEEADELVDDLPEDTPVAISVFEEGESITVQ